MRVVIIGGVAAGTKTAAKLLRQDRSAKVTIYTRSRDISYAGCGLPYACPTMWAAASRPGTS